MRLSSTLFFCMSQEASRSADVDLPNSSTNAYVRESYTHRFRRSLAMHKNILYGNACFFYFFGANFENFEIVSRSTGRTMEDSPFVVSSHAMDVLACSFLFLHPLGISHPKSRASYSDPGISFSRCRIRSRMLHLPIPRRSVRRRCRGDGIPCACRLHGTGTVFYWLGRTSTFHTIAHVVTRGWSTSRPRLDSWTAISTVLSRSMNGPCPTWPPVAPPADDVPGPSGPCNGLHP